MSVAVKSGAGLPTSAAAKAVVTSATVLRNTDICFIICFGLWLNVPCKKALVRKTCNSDSGSFSKDQAIADARSVAARRQEISQPSIFWRHNRCYWPVETFARARSPGDFVSAPDSVG